MPEIILGGVVVALLLWLSNAFAAVDPRRLAKAGTAVHDTVAYAEDAATAEVGTQPGEHVLERSICVPYPASELRSRHAGARAVTG